VEPLLRIENAITDLTAWLEAYNRMAPARKAAGVTEERVWQPCDDPRYVVVDLGFESAAAAESFRTFLHERVWSSSPVLVGAPQAVVLTEVNGPDGPPS
jgi:hypothetical protein